MSTMNGDNVVQKKMRRNGVRVVSIRFDRDLFQRVRLEARRQRRTLSNFIRCTMEDALKGRS